MFNRWFDNRLDGQLAARKRYDRIRATRRRLCLRRSLAAVVFVAFFTYCLLGLAPWWGMLLR